MLGNLGPEGFRATDEQLGLGYQVATQVSEVARRKLCTLLLEGRDDVSLK